MLDSLSDLKIFKDFWDLTIAIAVGVTTIVAFLKLLLPLYKKIKFYIILSSANHQKIETFDDDLKDLKQEVNEGFEGVNEHINTLTNDIKDTFNEIKEENALQNGKLDVLNKYIQNK